VFQIVNKGGQMKEEKILSETTAFCNECASRDCCPEEECILYRIEQLVLNQFDDKNEEEN
jgi:hypothetical protein